VILIAYDKFFMFGILLLILTSKRKYFRKRSSFYIY